ncbi:MAG: hypothetical protein Kow0029_24740 [Candidatus Rifleibacteriota bacterium]
MKSDENALVLIVDDNSNNLQVAGEILSRENYDIALAQSGPDAIEFIEKRKPDLILLDIMMPEMDGFKVCKFLKENIETKFIPIIFLTARAQIEDIIKGFELGGADYLTKPFNDKELVARVKTQLELVKLQEMLRNKNRKLLEEIRLRKLREKDLINYEKGRYLNVLVGGIAHEFNNLLQVIIGYGEIIENALVKNSETWQLQQMVLTAAKDAASMVKQLLLIADKNNKTKIKTIDLIKFIEDRKTLFTAIFPEGISFKYNLLDKTIFIKADCAELTQALVNLFLNASAAMEKKGKIEIYVDEFVPDARYQSDFNINDDRKLAMIEVKDNGRGIPENIIKNVFDPVAFMNKGNGVGLGLGMVNSVASKLGGHLEINSEPAKGTSCRLYIPIEENGQNVTKSSDIEKEKTAPKFQNNLVLVAEDEENVAYYEKKVLEDNGCRVLVAKNGKEAIDIFKKHSDRIDLVLMDIGLPIKSGVDAAKKILEIKPSVPVIYCTAYCDNEFDRLAETSPILQKPFKHNEILQCVADALHH